MNNSEALAFASYVNDLTYTIFYVFGRVERPNALMDWLRPMAIDDKSRALLMHEEPLYVAADFLGIDRLAPSFKEYEDKYQQFRSHFLYPGRSPEQASQSDHA